MTVTFFHDTPSSPCWTVNFAALRLQVLERLLAEPALMFTRLERAGIMDLFVATAKRLAARAAADGAEGRPLDWRDNPGLLILARDLEELGVDVPKWTLLFGWLAPESAAAGCPDLVAEVALRALDGTLGKPRRRRQAPPG
ncbi:MAG: hypothetical protein VKQ33_11775 [Candidatus Sericytochromatia bacterium]|nr:hypothetical protein [Candidatus Sericytochromatia bacterium]